MNRLILCLVVFIALSALCCRNDVLEVIPPVYQPIDSYSQDARILAVRLSSGVWINAGIAAEIDSALALVRKVRPTLDSIHTIPDFVLNELIVQARSNAAVKWSENQLLVGDPYLDSLAQTFQLAGIRPLYDSAFVLTFGQSLNIPSLARMYGRSSQIVWADPDRIIGDGNRIWAFKKSGIWDIVFSRGSGDCPAGCIARDYFYATVDLNLRQAYVVEELTSNSPPKIYRWNIPASYPATIFTNVTDILDHYSSDLWWERRHAIEVTSGFFEFLYPWNPYDYANSARWNEMRSDILSRKSDVTLLLQRAIADPDEDVRASAQAALREITPAK